jgi:4-hydroxy-tetrahydrodipicolinate synthase
LERNSDVLTGLLVPVVTPLDADGRLDPDSFGRHLRHVLDAGAHGLWINGTSGDFHAITEGEAIETVAIARDVAGPGVAIVAHVGDTATARTVARGRKSMAAGADHVAALTPYYADYAEDELERHCRMLAEATGVGMLLYQHPATGKSPMSVSSIEGLAAEGVVVGLKESGTDMAYFAELMTMVRETGSPLRAFHGAGARALETLELGTSGLITVIANLLPSTAAGLYDSFRDGRLEDAVAAQARLTGFGEAIVDCLPSRRTGPPVVAAYKFMLKSLGVIACDRVPDPLRPLDDVERAALTERVLPLVASQP